MRCGVAQEREDLFLEINLAHRANLGRVIAAGTRLV
jgi:hypothetical protein